MDLDEPRYSVSGAARKLQVHLSTAWRYVLHGVRGKKLRSQLLGGRRYVMQSDLEAFLNSEDEPQASTHPNHRVTDASQKLDDLLGE